MTDKDRAVQALNEMTWAVVPGECDLPAAAARVIRVVRDDLIMAWDAGQIRDLLDAERLLNERIVALTGRPTTTGDTTEATEPDDDTLTAQVAVVQRSRPTLGSTVTVTVGEWTWPVPEKYGTGTWMHRVGWTLRDHGWSVAGEPRLSTEPGVYEVPVRKIETTP